MKIESVDPRDIGWEVDAPAYRVYFWQQLPAPAGVAQRDMGYGSDEHRLTGAADVNEVLTWANDAAQSGSTFTVYVEHVCEGATGLIRLAGTDPTETS